MMAMSLERATPTNGAMISEAFTALASAGNGARRALIRTYVDEDLVLVVTEHEPERGRRAAGEPRRAQAVDGFAQQRTAALETLLGRRVLTTLDGRLADPDVDFELFLLRPEPRRRPHSARRDLRRGDFG
jgi:hypothetical protein